MSLSEYAVRIIKFKQRQVFCSSSKFGLIHKINHCINLWKLKDGSYKFQKPTYITERTLKLVLFAAQDTLFRGAGNKTWSDSTGAGNDKTAAANCKWKAQNGRKI